MADEIIPEINAQNVPACHSKTGGVVFQRCTDKKCNLKDNCGFYERDSRVMRSSSLLRKLE